MLFCILRLLEQYPEDLELVKLEECEWIKRAV